MDASQNCREDLPDPFTTLLDADVWHQDSHELRDLAETLVNRHPRFAWMVVDVWLTLHGQMLIDK